MLSNAAIQKIVDFVVMFSTNTLMPVMMMVFGLAVAMRILNYYTLKRQEFFAREFQKRLDLYLDTHQNDSQLSFFMMVKRLMMITYYEIFEVTALLQRRRADPIYSLGDRVFLIKQGFAYLVKKTLKQVRYLKHDHDRPDFLELSKNVFQNNPAFTKVFGLIPSDVVNDALNVLPGLFILGGIFGNFLGVMKALPELGGMNLADPVSTKHVMDAFLLKIAFSMSTSIIGILLSVALTMINMAFSAERAFMRTVETFDASLNVIWDRSTNNDLPADAMKFDEQKDPLEALAEQALNKEYARMRKIRLEEADVLAKGPKRDDIPKSA